MNGFTTAPLKTQSLLQRLARRRPPENAFVEIQNLLATTAFADLAASQIINILSEYEVPREEAMPTLTGLYEQALRYDVRDGSLSPEERAGLKQLRYVLDLDDAAANQAEESVLRSTYRDALQKALIDEHLSDDEKKKLDEMTDNFDLPVEVVRELYKAEVLAVMQKAFNQATADRRLTADEESRLVQMGENLGIRIEHDEKTQRVIERFKLLARVDAGELPVIQSNVILQRGEACHAQFACNLHEKRTITKRINYQGPSGRIRIMKGLSWRYGSVSVSRVTSEELRRIDSGVLYITNKRLLFNGAAKNLNTPLKKIIHFTTFGDGLQIEKESGRDQYFLGAGDLELIGGVLESVLRIGK